MKHIKRSFSSKLFNVCNYLFMLFASFIALYPFLHVIFASFSDGTQLVQQTGLLFGPAGFSLDGYKAVLGNEEIYTGYLNTIIYTVGGTALATVISVLLAYTMSSPRVQYRAAITKFVMVTMFFSGGMIPLYLVVRGLGLLDTRWAVILPGLLTTYNVMVMKTGFASVPISLEESALLDGANDFQILLKIVLPNVKATIAIIVLYYGVGHWNSWFSAMLYLTDRTKFPLQLFLREILIESSKEGMDTITTSNVFLDEVIKHATTVVATIPILAIYPFIQKYFVTGIMIGAVKE